jgi:hypothetical protein
MDLVAANHRRPQLILELRHAGGLHSSRGGHQNEIVDVCLSLLRLPDNLVRRVVRGRINSGAPVNEGVKIEVVLWKEARWGRCER